MPVYTCTNGHTVVILEPRAGADDKPEAREVCPQCGAELRKDEE